MEELWPAGAVSGTVTVAVEQPLGVLVVVLPDVQEPLGRRNCAALLAVRPDVVAGDIQRHEFVWLKQLLGDAQFASAARRWLRELAMEW